MEGPGTLRVYRSDKNNPFGQQPQPCRLLVVWLWASYLSSPSHLPITFLVQKAHLLGPKLLVALVLVDAVATS